MLRLYIIGIFILLVAIIANLIAQRLAISTWYDFAHQLSIKGFSVIKEVGLIGCFWLFVFYPLVLSLGYIIGDKVYKLF